jgi:steroid 5-alpha reductase family enzyme
MSLVWILSLTLKNSSIVDIFWGIGFVVTAWFYFFSSTSGYQARKLLLISLVTIWGLRLSLHIFIRNAGRGEDYRYRNLREATGKSWWWISYFKVFLLQGFLLWVISIPLLSAQFGSEPKRLTILDFLGLLAWIKGFFFEAVGDWQLSRFKNNPANKGKILNTGLWRFTRHPNYFGDSLQWWGFYFIAVAAGGFWTIYSPIIMTVLLIKVSGVKLLEKSLKNSKPGYKEYIEKTNGFIPWFPKR